MLLLCDAAAHESAALLNIMINSQSTTRIFKMNHLACLSERI